MICETTVRKYCKDDISLIENYYEADKSEEVYHCHHKREIDSNGNETSIEELKNAGLYYNRPAYELIFLTTKEHHYMHNLIREDNEYKFFRKGKYDRNKEFLYKLKKEEYIKSHKELGLFWEA